VLVVVLGQSDPLMLSTPLTMAILEGPPTAAAAAAVLLLLAASAAESALGVTDASDAAFAAAFAVRRLCLPAAARNFAVASALLQCARPAGDALTTVADSAAAAGCTAAAAAAVDAGAPLHSSAAAPLWWRLLLLAADACCLFVAGAVLPPAATGAACVVAVAAAAVSSADDSLSSAASAAAMQTSLRMLLLAYTSLLQLLLLLLYLLLEVMVLPGSGLGSVSRPMLLASLQNRAQINRLLLLLPPLLRGLMLTLLVPLPVSLLCASNVLKAADGASLSLYCMLRLWLWLTAALLLLLFC
jgi:hypothetical protein